MRNIILVLIAFALLPSCSQLQSSPPPKPDCEAKQWGTIEIVNNSKHGAKIFIDDMPKGVIWPNQVGSYPRYTPGTHKFRMVQSEGFMLSADEWKGSAEVLMCETISYKFGK